MRILLRMPNWLGDFLMALPLCEDLKTHYPEAHLSILAPTPFLELLKGNPFVDELINFSQKRIKERYDIGILTPNSFSSAWHFFRCRITKRIGFKNERREIFLNSAITFPEQRGKEHLVTTYKRLLIPLNIPLSKTAPTLYLQDNEVETFKSKIPLPEMTPLIGLHPLAAYGPAKCWPYFRDVLSHFVENSNEHFLLFGTESEKAKLEELASGLSPQKIHILAGKTTLRELACAMQMCSLIVSNDSGPMHLAACLKRPLIALFGSTEPVVTGPYGQGIVLQRPTFCSPCFKRECPIDFRCMKRLLPSIVIEEMKRELKHKEAKPLHVITC